MTNRQLQMLIAAAISSHTLAVMQGTADILGDGNDDEGLTYEDIPDFTYQAEPEVTQLTGRRWAGHIEIKQDYP